MFWIEKQKLPNVTEIMVTESLLFYVLWKWKELFVQSNLTLCDTVDCSLPDSSVHGILQARILEWVAMPSSRGSSWLRDQTQVSCITDRFFTIWAEVHKTHCIFQCTFSAGKSRRWGGIPVGWWELSEGLTDGVLILLFVIPKESCKNQSSSIFRMLSCSPDL